MADLEGLSHCPYDSHSLALGRKKERVKDGEIPQGHNRSVRPRRREVVRNLGSQRSKEAEISETSQMHRYSRNSTYVSHPSSEAIFT